MMDTESKLKAGRSQELTDTLPHFQIVKLNSTFKANL